MEDIPKYLSAEEYAKRSGMGVQEVKRQCNLGKIECFKTETGRYKIPIRKDSISREQYEKLLKENIELKTIINNAKKILIKEVI